MVYNTDVAYRLIIVDDERVSLDGMADLVDWNEMGFEVVGKFLDGEEAVAFLQGNAADVVLADIKMRYMGGLELARFVHQHHPETRIVLISAHQDFEMARESLRYGVASYLLKPFSLTEVYDVFTGLKRGLEEQRQSIQEESDKERSHDRAVSRIEENLVRDLLGGELTDRNEIAHRLSILGVQIDPERCRCTLIVLPLDAWNRNAPLDTSKVAALKKVDPRLYVCMLSTRSALYVLALCTSESRTFADSEMNESLENLRRNVDEVCSENVERAHPKLLPFKDILSVAYTPGIADPSVTAPSIEGRPDGEVIERVKAYIREHYDDNVSLEKLADVVYLSPTYISRLFKEKTGENYSTYVQETRIRAACRMLRNGNEKVSVVCEKSGFRDLKHFYRLFGKIMGTTPSRYRKEQAP